MSGWVEPRLVDVPTVPPPAGDGEPVVDPVEEARHAVTSTTADGAALLRADALRLPFADNTVDLIVTSPPYFALRSYRDGDEHYDGQIGSEDTPQAFLEALWAVTAECARVLKPSGSLFINLGDKYAGSGGHNNAGISGGPSQLQGASQRRVPVEKAARRNAPDRYNQNSGGVPAKSLMLLPERYRVGCVDRLGLIARAVIVWEKLNGMPESVNDRVRRSHEDWVHLVKAPRYYSAMDELRAPSAAGGSFTGGGPVVSGTASLTTASRAALGPELPATIHTDDGPTATRGWCQLRAEQETVRPAVAGDAESFQVLRAVGVDLRVEAPEGDYVVHLEPLGRATSDTPTPVAVHDALANLSPVLPPVDVVAATPVGVALTGVVLPDALGRAVVVGLEVAALPGEGLVARLALQLDEGEATLLVWDSFATHPQSLAQRNRTLAKLPGSVWPIATEPLRVPDWLGVDHFAAFPTEWPRRLILGWSPSGVCTRCGEGRRVVVGRRCECCDAVVEAHTKTCQSCGHRRGDEWKQGRIADDRLRTDAGKPGLHAPRNPGGFKSTAERAGEACGCPTPDAPTRPAVVLDPFGGTGTSAMVARSLGRFGVSVDLSADYLRLARWRVRQSGHGSKAVSRTWRDRQGSLFDGEVA